MDVPAGEDPGSGVPSPALLNRCATSPIAILRKRDLISCCNPMRSLIRLIDLEGLEQEEAAEKLGVSRKTAWRDLHEARRKIADALVNGKGIEMAGCTKAAEGQCPKCHR